jgi:hypothetical protein
MLFLNMLCLTVALTLSYRFSDLFPDVEMVRAIQPELNEIISQGVVNITKMLMGGMTQTKGQKRKGDGRVPRSGRPC